MKKILVVLTLMVLFAGCGPAAEDTVPPGRKGGYLTTEGRGVNPRCCGVEINPDAGSPVD